MPNVILAFYLAVPGREGEDAAPRGVDVFDGDGYVSVTIEKLPDRLNSPTIRMLPLSAIIVRLLDVT